PARPRPPVAAPVSSAPVRKGDRTAPPPPRLFHPWSCAAAAVEAARPERRRRRLKLLRCRIALRPESSTSTSMPAWCCSLLFFPVSLWLASRRRLAKCVAPENPTAQALVTRGEPEG